MMYGHFRTEWDNEIPFYNRYITSSGNTFTMTAIDLVICGPSKTKEVQNTIQTINRERYFKIPNKCKLSQYLHF